MKPLVMFFLMCVLSFHASAQADTTKNLSLKKGADQWNADSTQVEALDVHEVPDLVKQTLQRDSTYAGWKTNHFYFDRQSGLYLMEVKDSVSTRLYRFDKKGKEVSGNIPEL